MLVCYAVEYHPLRNNTSPPSNLFLYALFPSRDAGALVVTLATLAVTHHTSMTARAPDPLAAVETADRASTAWALRDDDDEKDAKTETDEVDARTREARSEIDTVSAIGIEEPRAPKRRAERVTHRSPFESEREEALVDSEDDRARKTAKRTHHRSASASSQSTESSLDFDFAADVGTADAMELEQYTGIARARRVKLERFEEVLRDESRMRDILRRAFLMMSRGAAADPASKGGVSLADAPRKMIFAEARATSRAVDDDAEARVGQKEEGEAEGPDASDATEDAGFEDASWSEDDYRTAVLSTKDITKANVLNVRASPGQVSDSTDDETMASLLKRIEENKARIAERVVQDDGELDEDAFIRELVREGAIIAPEEEPERSKKTSAGNYLDGEFDAVDLARIVESGDNRTLDERVNSFPKLEEKDVEDNARDEIPEAFVKEDVDAMEFDNVKEALTSQFDAEAPAPEDSEDGAEGPASAAAPSPGEAEEAPGPAESEEAAEAPASTESP